LNSDKFPYLGSLIPNTPDKVKTRIRRAGQKHKSLLRIWKMPVDHTKLSCSHDRVMETNWLVTCTRAKELSWFVSSTAPHTQEARWKDQCQYTLTR